MTKIKLVHRRLSGNEYMLGVYVSDWGYSSSTALPLARS